LVDEQHPDLAELPLGRRYDGWDMAVFRLGDELAVRLPRTADAVESLEAEARWLGLLSEGWTFPFPRVLRRGAPGHGYPWPWSIISWLPGTMASQRPLSASAGVELGRALAQVHAPAPADAPFNEEQSIELPEREPWVRGALDPLAGVAGPDGRECDVTASAAVWEVALAAEPPRELVWSHADLHGFNVISNDGQLGGIIDWADIAACDRAVDLGFLYLLLPASGIDAAWREYGKATRALDDAVAARARGVAVAMCSGFAMLDNPAGAAIGWRGLDALGLLRRA